MYLREKLDELSVLKRKVKELSAYVAKHNNDEVVKQLLAYMDDIQNIHLILNNVNSKTLITIGQSQIDLNTAVIIRDNIRNKIKLISLIIKHNVELDLLTLIKQRDTLIEEFNSINKAIRLADWGIKLD